MTLPQPDTLLIGISTYAVAPDSVLVDSAQTGAPSHSVTALVFLLPIIALVIVPAGPPGWIACAVLGHKKVAMAELYRGKCFCTRCGRWVWP